MTFQEIHHLVAHGEGLPPFQSLPDRLCYESLAKLKADYELTGADSKLVRIRKQDIRRAHEEFTEAHRQYMAVYKEYSDNCLKTGQDIKAILAGLNAENLDYRQLFALAVQCIDRMTHDEAFVRMVREKMRTEITVEEK